MFYNDHKTLLRMLMKSFTYKKVNNTDVKRASLVKEVT